jgi:hypothetical protein
VGSDGQYRLLCTSKIKIFGEKPTHKFEQPLNLKLLNLKLSILKSLNLKLFNLKRLNRNHWRNAYGKQWEFSTLFKIFIAEYPLSYCHQ